jgi:hypothetical protein
MVLGSKEGRVMGNGPVELGLNFVFAGKRFGEVLIASGGLHYGHAVQRGFHISVYAGSGVTLCFL